MFVLNKFLKKINQNFIKVILTLIIIYLILHKVDYNSFLQHIDALNNSFLIIAFIFLLPAPLLLSLRWFFIIQKIGSKISFIKTIKNMAPAISIGDLFASGIPLEVAKFFSLKELSHSLKIQLLIIEKIYAILIKIFFLVLITNVINIFYIKENITILIITSICIVLSPIFFLIFTKLFKNIKLINSLYEKINFFVFEKNINKKKIISTELIRNLIISLSYFFIFYSLFDLKTCLLLVVFANIIETVLRFQIFTIGFGFREFLFTYFSFLINHNIESQILLASIVFSFFMLIINQLNLICYLIFGKFLKE